MDQLCTRCAKLSLRSSSISSSSRQRLLVRSFSTSTICAEDSGKSKSPPNVLRPTRPPRSAATARQFVPRQSSAYPTAGGGQGQRAGGAQILQRTRRQGQQDRQGQQGQQRRRPEGGRQFDPELQGNLALPVRVKYADGSEADVPARDLLHPEPGFNEPEAVLGTREEIVDEMNGIDPEDEADAGNLVEPTDADLDQYITKHIDRPANPTEPIAYQPSAQAASELQKDWPDTPLSSTGLAATIVQKLEFLARRIPHGYQTPEQIAAYLEKGNFTRFESEEEKQKVLKLAQALAEKRANKLTERKGEQVTPADTSFADLSQSNDKKTLVDSMARGDYGEAEKQRMPFLDSIVRNLRNNSTYHYPEMSKFMAKVQSLIPAQAGNRRAAPKQAQAQR